MKIYNTKTFALGVFSLAFLALFVVTDFRQGFELNDIFLYILLAVFGIRYLARSLSQVHAKEDKLNEQDERNRAIRQKARSQAFLLSQVITLVCAFVCFFLARVPGNGDAALLGIGFAWAFFIALLTEIGTTLHYEHRM